MIFANNSYLCLRTKTYQVICYLTNYNCSIMKRALFLSYLSTLLFATGLYAQTCQIGDIMYNSILDAVDAVPASGPQTTITMIADEYLDQERWLTYEDSIVWVSNWKNIVLDLNSKALEKGFYVTSGSSLTIRDTGGAGRVEGSFLWGNVINFGFVRIEGGHFSCPNSTTVGDYSLISNQGQGMEIAGGTFEYGNKEDAMIWSNAPLEISGGTFTADCKYEVVANFGKLRITGGNFTRLGSMGDNSVVWTGENSTTDIEGGYFTTSCAAPTLYFNGDANISNAKVESTGKKYGSALSVHSGATVIINSGTFTSESQENTCMFVGGNSSLFINDGSFENKGRWNVVYVDVSGRAYIDGGTFTNNPVNTANNANTFVNFGYISISEDTKIPLYINNLSGYTGCIYTYSSAYSTITGGRFKTKSKPAVNGELGRTQILGGLFSNASNLTGYTDGYLCKNPDAETSSEYPYYVEQLPVSFAGKVWLRNVQTGRFLGAGDGSTYYTQSLTKTDGLCLNMLDVADGKYVAFMPFGTYNWGCWYLWDGRYLPFNNSFLGMDAAKDLSAKRIWVDRPAGNSIYEKKEVRPGVYSLYLMDYGYLGEVDGQVRVTTDGSQDAALWEIITYEDIVVR